jgi:integrase
MGQIDVISKDLETAKKNLLKSNISEENKKHIIGFINNQAASDISNKRLYKYYSVLKKASNFLSIDFKKANKRDIQELIIKINNMDNGRGQPASEWTKYTYKTILKRFYKWLNGDDEEYPKEVKWIHPKMDKRNKKLPEELLTMEDVKLIANETQNQRDRAFVLFLYESGARIGEIMSIRVKDFESDKYGAKVLIPEGKTGPRKIRIIASAPALSNWLTQHPDRKNKNSPLFCGISNYKRGLNVVYQNYRKILKKAANKASIDKPVNPHHFRHSRATELAKKLTEAQLCEYMGWITGSKEAATYVHLSGRDMDKAILSIHGLIEEKTEKDKFNSIKCPRCGIKNDPAAKFCSGCSLGLDEKSVMEYDNRREQALKTGFQIESAIEDKETLIATIDALSKRLEYLENHIKK